MRGDLHPGLRAQLLMIEQEMQRVQSAPLKKAKEAKTTIFWPPPKEKAPVGPPKPTSRAITSPSKQPSAKSTKPAKSKAAFTRPKSPVQEDPVTSDEEEIDATHLKPLPHDFTPKTATKRKRAWVVESESEAEEEVDELEEDEFKGVTMEVSDDSPPSPPPHRRTRKRMAAAGSDEEGREGRTQTKRATIGTAARGCNDVRHSLMRNNSLALSTTSLASLIDVAVDVPSVQTATSKPRPHSPPPPLSLPSPPLRGPSTSPILPLAPARRTATNSSSEAKNKGLDLSVWEEMLEEDDWGFAGEKNRGEKNRGEGRAISGADDRGVSWGGPRTLGEEHGQARGSEMIEKANHSKTGVLICPANLTLQ